MFLFFIICVPCYDLRNNNNVLLQVSEGQEMLVLEAMKMQNSLTAGKMGKVYLLLTFYTTRGDKKVLQLDILN